MSTKKVIEKIRVVSNNVTPPPTGPTADSFNGKVGLVTGGSKGIGLAVGINLAKRYTELDKQYKEGRLSSRIYLTTRFEKDIPRLTEQLAANHDEEVTKRIKFAQLDLLDKGSLFKLYQKIKDETITLDLVVNNAQKFELPSQNNEGRFKTQCKDIMAVNFEGMKRICKTFTPMLNAHGRIVLCSSHLGHLSNIDGTEPAAYKLRKRFADKNLKEAQLDILVNEFLDDVKEGNGAWVQKGWPSCPYSVSKIAVNAYARILQEKLTNTHDQKKIVVNAVHHGYNHKLMNAGRCITKEEASDFVASFACLPEDHHIRGNIVWKGTQVLDSWQYGGLDDNTQVKEFTAVYEMEKDAETMHDMNTGFCLTG